MKFQSAVHSDYQVIVYQTRFCESTHMWYFTGSLYSIKGKPYICLYWPLSLLSNCQYSNFHLGKNYISASCLEKCQNTCSGFGQLPAKWQSNTESRFGSMYFPGKKTTPPWKKSTIPRNKINFCPEHYNMSSTLMNNVRHWFDFVHPCHIFRLFESFHSGHFILYMFSLIYGASPAVYYYYYYYEPNYRPGLVMIEYIECRVTWIRRPCNKDALTLTICLY